MEAEHGECAEKVRIALEQAVINLKAANDIHNEFDEFTTKVQKSEKKVSRGCYSCCSPINHTHSCRNDARMQASGMVDLGCR